MEINKKEATLIISLTIIISLFAYTFNNYEEYNSGAVTTSLKCEDTDENKIIAGTSGEDLTDIFLSGAVKTKEGNLMPDTCKENILVETYCDRTGKQATKEIKCNYGCERGKCMRSPCQDPDKQNHKNKGTISGYLYNDKDFLGINPVQSKQYTDICQSETKVKEYYCAGSTIRFEIFNCLYFGQAYKCIDGKCDKT